MASERTCLRETDVGWPLEEIWVDGDLLGFAESLEVGSVTLVLDVPADELPWLALHPAGEWVGSQLRLGKRPMRWSYRPSAWPVWNHEHRRLVRFWSATGGTDEDVVEALQSLRLDGLLVTEPSAEQLERQLDAELTVSRRHLRTVLDRYWDHDWRREHGRYDESPEDHLWRAASAVSEMQDALDELRG